jgi:hypothetical protein
LAKEVLRILDSGGFKMAKSYKARNGRLYQSGIQGKIAT